MRLSIHNEGGRGWGVKSCRCLFSVDFGSLTLMPHGMMLDEVGGISWVVLTPTNLSFWLDARKCEKMWVKWHIEVLETFATIRDLFVLSGYYGSKSFLTILVESYYVNLINVVNCKSLIMSELSDFVFEVVVLGLSTRVESFCWCVQLTIVWHKSPCLLGFG